MTTAPLLALENVSLSLHGQTLVRDLSLHLHPGETLALTGESGSGKSLTALAIMGLLPARMTTQGRITFDGIDLGGLGTRRRDRLRGAEMSMVFQEPMSALNPLQTIGQQIAEVFAIHRHPLPDPVDLLASVGLDLPPDRYPHQLSGGQRQRVVIAIATALKPRMIIADEPTTALDVTTQAQILTLLKGLARDSGSALLFITHDLAVVSQVADRMAVLQQGTLVESGPVAQVLMAPAHPYTRALRAAADHRADLPPAAPGATLLQARNVTLRHPATRRQPDAPPAVRDVSFDIRNGERIGLVGPSGCGKSTLARALLGLQPLTGGTITLDGAPLDGADRTAIQIVFQDPYGSFNPRHRVRRLLAEPFHLLRPRPPKAEIDARIIGALQEVGLQASDADKHIHAFSGGQRQRLAIARALVLRPRLIVLDEAVSALDVRVRAQVLDLLAQLSRDHGLAWLFISHDLSVVRSVSDRVLVMQDGQIVEDAATEALFGAPQHPQTRRLLAAAPRLPDRSPIEAPAR